MIWLILFWLCDCPTMMAIMALVIMFGSVGAVENGDISLSYFYLREAIAIIALIYVMCKKNKVT